MSLRSSRTLYTQLHLVPTSHGLIKGASQGAGLGAKFLSVHQRSGRPHSTSVRCFHNDDIEAQVHSVSVSTLLDDMGVVAQELMLADLATVEKRLETSGDQKAKAMDSTQTHSCSTVSPVDPACPRSRIPILDVQWKEEELSPRATELRLLTHKPLTTPFATSTEASGADGNELSARVHTLPSAPHPSTPLHSLITTPSWLCPSVLTRRHVSYICQLRYGSGCCGGLRFGGNPAESSSPCPLSQRRRLV